MKLTEISVWKDRKIQIEEYEPYSFAFGMKAELSDVDDPDKVKALLEEFVDEWLEFETQKWKQPRKAMRNPLMDKPLMTKIDGKDTEVPF